MLNVKGVPTPPGAVNISMIDYFKSLMLNVLPMNLIARVPAIAETTNQIILFVVKPVPTPSAGYDGSLSAATLSATLPTPIPASMGIKARNTILNIFQAF